MNRRHESPTTFCCSRSKTRGSHQSSSSVPSDTWFTGIGQAPQYLVHSHRRGRRHVDLAMNRTSQGGLLHFQRICQFGCREAQHFGLKIPVSVVRFHLRPPFLLAYSLPTWRKMIGKDAVRTNPTHYPCPTKPPYLSFSGRSARTYPSYCVTPISPDL